VTDPADELLSVRQAAKLSARKPVTIQRWIRLGELPAVKLPGRTGSYVIRRGDLDAQIVRRPPPAQRRRA